MTRDTGGTVVDGGDTGTEDTGGPQDVARDTGSDTGGADGDSDDGGIDGGDTADTDAGSQLAFVVSAANFMEKTARVATVVDDSGSLAGEKTYQTGDLILDRSGGRLFALNRYCSGFGAQESCDRDAGEVEQLRVAGDGSITVDRTLELPTDVYNPYGTGVASGAGRTYVTSYFTSSIYAYEGGTTPAGTIDVSMFDTGSTQMDDDPEPSDVAIEGRYAYFVLLRLSGFRAENNSVIVGYDTQSESIIDMNPNSNTVEALDLEGANAFAGIDRTPSGGWTVALTGSFTDQNMDPALDGRITSLEPENDGRLSVGETLVDETTLDGNINAYRMVSETRGFAVVSKGQSARVVAFDAGQSPPAVAEVTTGATTLCTTPDHAEIWIGRSTMSGNTFVGYDAETGDPLSGPTVEVERTPTSCRFVETGG